MKEVIVYSDLITTVSFILRRGFPAGGGDYGSGPFGKRRSDRRLSAVDRRRRDRGRGHRDHAYPIEDPDPARRDSFDDGAVFG